MESSKEDILDDGVDYTGKTVALDLSFLFNMFMREGAKINMRVVKGVPEGANALGAGIANGSLIVVFDTEVPEEIWFEDITDNIINPELN